MLPVSVQAASRVNGLEKRSAHLCDSVGAHRLAVHGGKVQRRVAGAVLGDRVGALRREVCRNLVEKSAV